MRVRGKVEGMVYFIILRAEIRLLILQDDIMKTFIHSFIMLFATAIIFSGCSKPIEKKLAGTWQVEDMLFKADFPLDETVMAASEESQKSIIFELREDYSARVVAGTFSSFDANWIYKESENAVFVIFAGTADTIPLGIFKDGKLINVETNSDIEITTIYAKGK